jgi:hypothetical protein
MIRSADEGGNANPAYGLLRANPVYGPGGSDPFAGQATGAPPAPNPAERARVEALLKLRTYLQTLWSVMMPFAC